MDNKVIIGRAPECDIVVDQAFGRVSNEHATLEIQDGQLIYKDHSSNGTMINGRLIHHSSIAIQNGDKIMLADTYELNWPTILRLFLRCKDALNDSMVHRLRVENVGLKCSILLTQSHPKQVRLNRCTSILYRKMLL